jgi:hypothetical protein
MRQRFLVSRAARRPARVPQRYIRVPKRQLSARPVRPPLRPGSLRRLYPRAPQLHLHCRAPAAHPPAVAPATPPLVGRRQRHAEAQSEHRRAERHAWHGVAGPPSAEDRGAPRDLAERPPALQRALHRPSANLHTRRRAPRVDVRLARAPRAAASARNRRRQRRRLRASPRE